MLIRLGREPVVLPEPLGALALQVAATRRGHAALGDDGTSAWLFPGGRPGQPISAFQLSERLRQIGIHCGQARSAALFQLATDLPAAVLARMLGIHISVAVQWQRAIRRRLDGLRRRRQPPDQTAARSVTSRNARPDVTGDARCPVCGRQLPDRDRPHGGRKARYCSGACKAKAYRTRQQAGQPAQHAAGSRRPPGTPASSRSGSRSANSSAIMADTASGQQALFASPGTARRRTRPAETARTLHRLIAELAALAVAATVTERVTIRQAQGGTTQTMSLFDEAGNGRITRSRHPDHSSGTGLFRQF